MSFIAPRKPRAKPRHPERDEQETVKRLLRSLGAKFWVAGTTRKKGDHPGTMQTPGLADIPFVFLPRRHGHGEELIRTKFALYDLVVIEMKSPEAARSKNGGLSEEQLELQHYCELAGITYIHGDAKAITQWLIGNRYLRADAVAHYYAPS